jgi:hypothetical protein
VPALRVQRFGHACKALPGCVQLEDALNDGRFEIVDEPLDVPIHSDVKGKGRVSFPPSTTPGKVT